MSQDLGNQSLHWISGAENGVPVMPITGTAVYSLVGATSPTDSAGNVGVLGSVGLTYTLRDERGTPEVTGAAAFGNPQ